MNLFLSQSNLVIPNKSTKNIMHKVINGFICKTQMLQCLNQKTTTLSELLTLCTQHYISLVLIGSETQIITFG
jgi:hypothetical protein